MTSAVAAQRNGLGWLFGRGQPLVDAMFQVVHTAGGAGRIQNRRVLVPRINSKAGTGWHILGTPTVYLGLRRSETRNRQCLCGILLN
jgi:hypothetical protein